MEEDLVVAHKSQRRIREEATNTGKRKRCTLPLRQKIQHDQGTDECHVKMQGKTHLIQFKRNRIPTINIYVQVIYLPIKLNVD